MNDRDAHYDVVVVGAGNAALCAALAALESGSKVLVLEAASEDEKGGNSYFTAGGFRFVHDGLEDVCKDILTDLSPAEKDIIATFAGQSPQAFYDTIMDVTNEQADPDLAWALVNGSRPTMAWLRTHGVRFLPMFGRQSVLVNGKHHFHGGGAIESSGGGAGLVEAEMARVRKLGGEIRFATAAVELLQGPDRRITGVKVRTRAGYETVSASAVVLACGGFESNPQLRVQHLGPGWDLAKVRGTAHNMGAGIQMALAVGARPHGNWSGCHACEWDVAAPPYGDRWVLDNFQKHSYFLGIVVNANAERFLDEGENFRNLTYAKYGREILKQPKRLAIQIFDQKTAKALRDEYRIKQITKAESDTIAGLAEQLMLDPAALERTVAEYNAACGSQPFNPAILDGKGTTGITPPKSNWALTIDQPPYLGFVTTTGVTFTFGGLKINLKAEVQDTTDSSIPGLFAAGELVGGLWYENYPGGAGLMSGAVFGRQAGTSAAGFAASVGARG